MDKFPPSPCVNHLGCFKFFWQLVEIFAYIHSARCKYNGKNKKSFHYFFWTSLGSRVSIKINFFRQVHFKLSAVWYCSHCVNDAGGKFAYGVFDTGDAPCSNVNDTKTKAEMFRYRSSLSERNQNVLMCSKKGSRTFYLVQKLWIEIITFWCVPERLRSKSGHFC